MKAAVLILALAVAGCAAPAPPQDQFYRLVTAPPPPLARPPLPGVVEVSRFGAEGLVSDRAMLYSDADKPDQLKHYTYHLWAEAPPLLLQDQLVRTLRQSHAAAEVVTADLRVPPDFVVEGRIHRFEQIAGPTPKVVAEVEIGVVRMHGNALLLLKTYHVETASLSEQPADAVHSFETAVGEMFAHFVVDLSQISANADHVQTSAEK